MNNGTSTIVSIDDTAVASKTLMGIKAREALGGLMEIMGAPMITLDTAPLSSYISTLIPYTGSNDKPFTDKMWCDGMDIASDMDCLSSPFYTNISSRSLDRELLYVDIFDLLSTPDNILRDYIADKMLELLYNNTKERRKIYSSKASLLLGYKNTLPVLMTKKEYDYIMINDVFKSLLKSSKNISPGKTLVNWN